jgi:hypothetical protein
MNRLKNFWKNHKGEMAYDKFIYIAIAIFIATALVGAMYTQISTTNTSEFHGNNIANSTTYWTDLPGGAGAVTLYQLIFFIFIAAIVIWIVREAIK